jgi:hypothetical protein
MWTFALCTVPRCLHSTAAGMVCTQVVVLFADRAAEGPGPSTSKQAQAKAAKAVTFSELVAGVSPVNRQGNARARLPAALAQAPNGPPHQHTPNRATWNVEDVTVLLNGIQEYGSALPM